MQTPSNTIVSICLNHEAAEAQRMILEEHGYHVVIANDLREVDRISRHTSLDCAILGADLGSGMKHAVATQLCDNLPAIAILEEYSGSPVLPDADHVLAGNPADLLAVIGDLLLPYGQRHTAHLRRKSRALVERAQEMCDTAKYVIRQSRQTRAYSKRNRHEKKDGKLGT